MAIYTKNGDLGYSNLLDGVKKSKSSPEFNVLGKLDELQALIYVCLFYTSNEGNLLTEITHDIQKIGSYIAGAPLDTLSEVLNLRLEALEREIDAIEEKTTDLKNFKAPNKTELSLFYNLTRVKSREVERNVIELLGANLSQTDKIVITYINRLSDYFFAQMLVS